MKSKLILAFVLVFAIALLSLTAVYADEWFEYSEPDVAEMTVYVNGEDVWFGECLPDPLILRWNCTTEQTGIPALEREEEAEIRVTFTANNDFEKARVKAWIGGYSEDIEAETSLFDVFENNTYTKNLELFIPKDIDALDSYTLHVDIEQKSDLSGVDESDVDIEIQRMANNIEIMSVELYDSGNYYRSCSTCTVTFEAGTTLYVDVAVKNRGNYEAEDVYVRVSLVEPCIERIVYLGDLEENDEDDDDNEDAKSVTVALYIPEETYAGTYTLEVEAYKSKVSDEEVRHLIIEGPGKKTTTTPTTVATRA